MEIKNITTKNLMNKYNNFAFEAEDDEEQTIFLTIYMAS